MQNKDKGMFALVLAGSTVLVIGLIVAACWNTRIIQDNNQMAVQIPNGQQLVPEPETPEAVKDQSISTANWRDFVSRKCGFSFMYPAEITQVSPWIFGKPILKAGAEKMFINQSTGEEKKAIDICSIKTDYYDFHMRPMSEPDPNTSHGKGYNPDRITPAQVKSWDAKRVAEKILEINKAYNQLRRAENPDIPSYDAVMLEEIQLKDRKVYQFTLKGDLYIDWSSDVVADTQRAFNSPVQKVPDSSNTFSFVSDNQGQVYFIYIPVVREDEYEYARIMLSTLEFFN